MQCLNGISEISKPSVILKLYAETRKRTFTYLVKSLIFHLLCTFKFKGKNVAETLPFIENISKKTKMLLLAQTLLKLARKFVCYIREILIQTVTSDEFELSWLKSRALLLDITFGTKVWQIFKIRTVRKPIFSFF